MHGGAEGGGTGCQRDVARTLVRTPTYVDYAQRARIQICLRLESSDRGAKQETTHLSLPVSHRRVTKVESLEDGPSYPKTRDNTGDNRRMTAVKKGPGLNEFNPFSPRA